MAARRRTVSWSLFEERPQWCRCASNSLYTGDVVCGSRSRKEDVSIERLFCNAALLPIQGVSSAVTTVKYAAGFVSLIVQRVETGSVET